MHQNYLLSRAELLKTALIFQAFSTDELDKLESSLVDQARQRKRTNGGTAKAQSDLDNDIADIFSKDELDQNPKAGSIFNDSKDELMLEAKKLKYQEDNDDDLLEQSIIRDDLDLSTKSLMVVSAKDDIAEEAKKRKVKR